jgi:Flp pilus assembly protein TadG
MARARKRLLSCESGSAAVEAALVLPPFIMLSLGIISACVAVFAASSLHFAVEGAARCYSINSTQCGSASATQSYAQTLYTGPSNPAFSASTPSCGHQVTGTLNYSLVTGVVNWTIPLSATACFP